MGFIVKYKVTGFDGERTTEVYPTEVTAQQHADDIRTYEGVEYTIVEPTPMRKS